MYLWIKDTSVPDFSPEFNSDEDFTVRGLLMDPSKIKIRG
jgi:hypothetical protein